LEKKIRLFYSVSLTDHSKEVTKVSKLLCPNFHGFCPNCRKILPAPTSLPIPKTAWDTITNPL